MWIDDNVIRKCQNPLVVDAWIPTEPIIVLGRSNEADKEVFIEGAARDKVQVLQRYGGGGTVILYPGCVVLSIGAWVKDRFRNDYFFRLLNQAFIDLMVEAFPDCRGRLGQNGISDITLDEKKIAGTSLFRSRNYLLYQASLIVELDLGLIVKYLPHPSREPEYRAKRSHADFLTGLSAASGQITTQKVLHLFELQGMNQFTDRLANDAMAVQDSQVPHLFGKVDRQ